MVSDVSGVGNAAVVNKCLFFYLEMILKGFHVRKYIQNSESVKKSSEEEEKQGQILQIKKALRLLK